MSEIDGVHLDEFAHEKLGKVAASISNTIKELQFNYLKELRKIQCPVLFMMGEDSPIHPPAAAEEMVKEINPELVHYYLFKNAGAPVYKDSPEEAYKVVYDFIMNYQNHLSNY